MATEMYLEQIAPHIAGISDDLDALAADPNGRFHEYSEEITQFAGLFRNDLETCCAYHKFQQIAEMQMSIQITIHQCDCDDTLRHDLLQEIVNIIGNRMNVCTLELVKSAPQASGN